MKKIIISITLLLFTFLVFGNEITFKQAQETAENYLSHNTQLRSTSKLELNDAGNPFVNTATSTRNTTSENRDLYIFNINEDNGFIIVAGDDAATPILGYSNNGNIDTQQTPRNVIKWLEVYKQQVQYIKTNKSYKSLMGWRI